MNENSKQSRLQLHQFLRTEKEGILDDWRKLSKQKISAAYHLSDKQQRNRMPELLESIAANAEKFSASQDSPNVPRKWPKHHAQQRWEFGFTLEETTREYSFLRRVIFSRLTPRIDELTADEIAFLNEALDESVLEAVTNYISKANQRLTSEKERLKVTLECIGDGFVCTDSDGKINYMNPAAQGILGCSLEYALGQQVNDIMITLDEGTRERLKCAAQCAIENGRMTHRGPDVLLRRPDGKLIPAEETAAPLRNASGELMGAVSTFRDISEITTLTQRLGYLSAHDALTGLPNRAMMVNRLYDSLTEAEQQQNNIAIFHLDIDQFKDTNDMFGRSAGDMLLRKVAKRLGSCIAPAENACRAGNDEFTVFAEVQDQQNAVELCETLHECIRRSFKIDNNDINITVSIGISMYPDDGGDPHRLLMHAETASKRAKAEGRNTGTFFTDLMNRDAEERHQLQLHLKQALSKGQLTLNFQPQISLSSGKIKGAEALLRWEHPEFGQVSPARFIPIAEQHGDLMVEIGDWVLSQACHQLRIWQDAGYQSLRISVNVSIVQLRRNNLVKHISELLERYQLPPSLLQLEITESLLMTHIAGAIEQINALKALGIDISVDDFGTGYSSLSYLQELPVDELKIDKRFLRDVTQNHEKKAIIKTIISLGENLGIRVLAEGVEDVITADFLKENGCECAQGFFYSKAVHPEMFEAQYLRQL